MGYPLTITDGRPRHLQGRKQHDSLSRESLCPLRDESTLRESRRDERMPAARAELCRVELYHPGPAHRHKLRQGPYMGAETSIF